MSIIDVKKEFSTAVYTLGENRTAGVSYTVLFSSPPSTPEVGTVQANNAPTIPRYKQIHPVDRALFVDDVSSIPVSPTFYRVTVRYKTSAFSKGEDSPLEAPWDVVWEFVTTEEVMEKDLDDKVVKNEAGEPFDPPVTRDVSDLVLKVTRNEAEYDPERSLKYENAVNEDRFTADGMQVEPGRALMRPITAVRIIEGDLTFWRVSYEIHFRNTTDKAEEEWFARRLNVGFMVREAAGQPPVMAKDVNGHTVVMPIALDDQGFKLGEGKKPKTMLFRRYEMLPFGVFDL